MKNYTHHRFHRLTKAMVERIKYLFNVEHIPLENLYSRFPVEPSAIQAICESGENEYIYNADKVKKLWQTSS